MTHRKVVKLLESHTKSGRKFCRANDRYVHTNESSRSKETNCVCRCNLLDSKKVNSDGFTCLHKMLLMSGKCKIVHAGANVGVKCSSNGMGTHYELLGGKPPLPPQSEPSLYIRKNHNMEPTHTSTQTQRTLTVSN